MREPAAHALDRSGACEEYCPHPEELAKQASRRMDTTHGLAAILRDARKGALLRMRLEIYSQPRSQGRPAEGLCFTPPDYSPSSPTPGHRRAPRAAPP